VRAESIKKSELSKRKRKEINGKKFKKNKRYKIKKKVITVTK
jgi:hypothetical protein